MKILHSCSCYIVNLTVCNVKQVILKGIDKGDIVSSGAPQVSKEGAAGRSSVDFPQPRRMKLGNSCLCCYTLILPLFPFVLSEVIGLGLHKFP